MRFINRKAISGQALPEMVIAFPLVVILIMGIIQIALLYRGKATLNNATFLAARSGSLNHGFVENMSSVFWDRMLALGHVIPALKSAATTEGLFGNPNQVNLAATRQAVEVSQRYRPITVLWPTKAVFNHFAIKKNELEPCSGSDCPFSDYGGAFRLAAESIFEIPLENQDARDQSLQSVDGGSVDLQDANLLSIKSLYCYDLEVPVANFIIWRTMRTAMKNNTDWRQCETLSQRYGENHYLIPMTGHAIVRMQTGFRCESDAEEGRDCENI